MNSRKTGFTLIELLVSMSVIAMLIGMAAPAMLTLVGARGVPQTADQISALLEYSRNEAMTRQTYVWVLFANTSNSAKNNELVAVAVASRDGTADTSAGNLMQLSKVVHGENIVLSDTASLKSATSSLIAASQTPKSVNANTVGLTYAVAGKTFSKSLTFTPRGEALLRAQPSSQDGFTELIDLSVRQSRGGAAPAANADDAAILLYGASGRVQVVRL